MYHRRESSRSADTYVCRKCGRQGHGEAFCPEFNRPQFPNTINNNPTQDFSNSRPPNNTGANNFDRNNMGMNNFDRNNIGLNNFDRSNIGPNNFDRSNIGPNNFDRSNIGPNNFNRNNMGTNIFDRNNMGTNNFDGNNMGTNNFERNNMGANNFNRNNIGTNNFDRNNAGMNNFDRNNMGMNNFDRNNFDSSFRGNGFNSFPPVSFQPSQLLSQQFNMEQQGNRNQFAQPLQIPGPREPPRDFSFQPQTFPDQRNLQVNSRMNNAGNNKNFPPKFPPPDSKTPANTFQKDLMGKKQFPNKRKEPPAIAQPKLIAKKPKVSSVPDVQYELLYECKGFPRFDRTPSKKHLCIPEIKYSIPSDIREKRYRPTFLEDLRRIFAFDVKLVITVGDRLKFHLRALKFDMRGLSALLEDWVTREGEEKHQMVVKDFPFNKQRIIQILTEKMKELLQDFGDPQQIYDSIQKQKQSKEESGNQKTQNTDKSSNEKLLQLQKQLLLTLYADCAIRDAEQRLSVLYQELEDLKKSQEGLKTHTYLILLHLYNKIFTPYIPKDVNEALKKYSSHRTLGLTKNAKLQEILQGKGPKHYLPGTMRQTPLVKKKSNATESEKNATEETKKGEADEVPVKDEEVECSKEAAAGEEAIDTKENKETTEEKPSLQENPGAKSEEQNEKNAEPEKVMEPGKVTESEKVIEPEKVTESEKNIEPEKVSDPKPDASSENPADGEDGNSQSTSQEVTGSVKIEEDPTKSADENKAKKTESGETSDSKPTESKMSTSGFSNVGDLLHLENEGDDTEEFVVDGINDLDFKANPVAQSPNQSKKSQRKNRQRNKMNQLKNGGENNSTGGNNCPKPPAPAPTTAPAQPNRRNANLHSKAERAISIARSFNLPHMQVAANDVHRKLNERTLVQKDVKLLFALITLERRHQKDVYEFSSKLK